MPAINDIAGNVSVVDARDLWRQIPPEEKFEVMARAHAKSTVTCFITLVVSGTLAIGLQIPWIFWSSFVAIPFIFQFAAGKAWRHFRPMMMLEYLAARAAGRRYAFAANARDLTLAFIFKGHIERQFGGDEAALAALEASLDHVREAEVWVALFNDALILMSEQPGGARLEFAHLVNDSLEIEGISPEGESEYSNNREVYLSYSDRKNAEQKKIKLVSRYPASIVVFEKKVLKLKAEWKQREHQSSLQDAQDAIAAQSVLDNPRDY